jgi:uncharacterized PurR-regulated membrane protein YhhQ (DUF165 family)
MVVLSIVLFDQMLNFSIFGMQMELSGAVVPYVFLYPVSFIVLRVYGFQQVNYMIGSMIIVSLFFVVMSTVVAQLSSNTTDIHTILMSSYKMYLAGFIGMPAGIYSSFLIIQWLEKMRVSFCVFSLCVATIVGEAVNTMIVFPIGFHGQYTMQQIFNRIIVDAMLFKIIVGIVLAFVAMGTIHFLLFKKAN